MLIILQKTIQDETTCLQKVRQQRLYFIQLFIPYFKKNEAPKSFFCSEALEELFLVSQRTFQWTDLKIFFFLKGAIECIDTVFKYLNTYFTTLQILPYNETVCYWLIWQGHE